ncbi:LysR family transcriptional regulator [Gilvimarinus agarilyticus]|uniref:LysR family transcriptional regulator n=1 Tax=Gammaproteobacteria TaxID=1236 RepID=UPI0016804205|nr:MULTISPECIES: LysR family transcriptional regulator [Gammaproteobacteria]MBD1574646.1 LysR family transcriptional regulator [Vibrio sp. S17_S38]MBU2885609.1 LysR family transcriptional regulator [Gilvimarinus agarilyticus]MDO6570475.1 LysR family transcriptional regulator [Gilvimarinus sp. 2_MG-2023]
MLDNLKIFISAAEQRSLSGAAEDLGMTIATVSRRVNELEQKLQCELFHRSNKGLRLTSSGQAYYEETADFIHALDLRLLNLERSLNSLEGELRVMAPTNIGNGPLNQFWRSFVENNAGISLNILLGDPGDDVISNQVDIAIRSGPQQNSSLIQQKLGTIKPILVASSAFKDRMPKDLSTLELLPSIAAQLFSEWTLSNGDEERLINKKHNHISNDMAVTLNLVNAGAGIALLPMSMVYHEIENGTLIRILPTWSGVPREISLLWPKKRTLSARSKRFREELIEFLRKQAWFSMAF